MQCRQSLFAFVVSCLVCLFVVSTSVAQINTATLSGVITDQQGLAVRGAKVTVTFQATGAERSATADDAGHYTIVGLVPGVYKMRVEGGASFAPYEKPSVQVLVGSETIANATLTLGAQTQTVTVTTESNPVETTRSESAQTVEELQIDNLPINGRNYINFTLLNSQTTRDMSPTIGPAPNSGLSISGARARGNMVSVDGADAVDNSVNAIRSTVSQEAVQEFQMILSNYNPEYGRASGGVINIVTKSGSNDFHGDVYGYLRNKAFQSRNPFSGEVDAEGNLVPVKQAYTRVQTGLTAGGAIKKDKTFYFFSYEYTQREEAGFSSIGTGNFGVTTGLVPCIPAPLSMTPSQLGFYQGALGLLTGNGQACTNSNPQIQAQIAGLQQAAVVTGATSNVAVNADLNKNVDGTTIPMTTLLGFPAAIPGSKYFPVPVACPVGQQVNGVICLPNGQGIVPLPATYVALDSLRGNFPIMEKTSLYSARLDQRWDNRNTSFIRAGFSPSQVTGIQSTSQNQVFGQNAGSRVGASHYRDLNITFQHDTILSDTAFNEFRFQFARRGLHFGFSPLEGGSNIGVNIPGYAYFGREPYSTVDRIERRYQFSDSGTITHGRHTFKVGVDFNLIQLRSSKPQIFELDFGGDYTFGSLALLPSPTPALTGLQTYGFGIPTEWIQGIGTSNQPFNNIPVAFFAQDSWRVTRKLTLNYGLRYDLELTPLFAPATPINAAAEQALGVIEGLPRDYKNVAPRIGLAWDPFGDGKTVVRAGYGLFYDHPLLAIAFDSTTADGGRSVQLLSGPGVPSACGLNPLTPVCGNGLDSSANLNGASVFTGALNALPNMFYLPSQQKFNPYPQNSLFANQNYLAAGFPLTILPFTLPVDKNFKYGYAQQANLTVERVIAGTWKLSAGYQWTRGIHLYRPIDLNSTDPQLLSQNMLNAFESGLSPAAPTLVAVPVGTGIPNSCLTTGANSSMLLIAPGALGLGFAGSPSCSGAPVGYVGTPAVFNYFRPSGPNPSFASVAGGYGTEVALAHLAGFPVGFGVPVPYNSVDAQVSDASSWYNALTVNLEKRFSRHFQLLSSYTWSHSIDNGTDLQSTLEPQDSRFPQLERSNSVNDQPNRWISSAVFQSSPHVPGQGFVKNFFSDFTVAPIIEWSSGRPFQVITGEDTRLDLSASNDRPSIAPAGTAGATTSPYIHGVAFVPANLCLTNAGAPFTVPATPIPGLPQISPTQGCNGNLSRNPYFMPNFFQFDLRLSKGINLGEHLRMDLIADGFNLTNHTNISGVNQLCDPQAGTTCTAGQPTAAYDARQFQFALKLSW